MKKKYELQGMSCGGCVSSVKNALLKHPDVEDVEVHLHPQMAVLTIKEHIEVAELQAKLTQAGHYTIKEVA